MGNYNNGFEDEYKNDDQNYNEETAAEIAAPYRLGQEDSDNTERVGGKGLGISALILAILSLFYAPLVWGTLGIIVGFLAIRRGSMALGSWSIGISAFSIIVRMLIVPFF
ncbi:DUF4190 domain-containing protein [Bacillus massiliigorillae]|uniref:DUF4190 domain-containing protein n=1 Tax=Bacillus massiliigorillae TaxID=1243664 RepID=UPI0003A2A2AC|nr:DUF4190 domain-containing protein [Bacillus massiliigorillae]